MRGVFVRRVQSRKKCRFPQCLLGNHYIKTTLNTYPNPVNFCEQILNIKDKLTYYLFVCLFTCIHLNHPVRILKKLLTEKDFSMEQYYKLWIIFMNSHEEQKRKVSVSVLPGWVKQHSMFLHIVYNWLLRYVECWSLNLCYSVPFSVSGFYRLALHPFLQAVVRDLVCWMRDRSIITILNHGFQATPQNNRQLLWDQCAASSLLKMRN